VGNSAKRDPSSKEALLSSSEKKPHRRRHLSAEDPSEGEAAWYLKSQNEKKPAQSRAFLWLTRTPIF